jgi:isoleucyl-tRNA synthetase
LAGSKEVQENVVEEMKKVRDVVSKGLDVRVKNAIKVRQPLSVLTTGIKIDDKYLSLIQDEVNVKEIVLDTNLGDVVSINLTVTPELKKEGDTRELIRAVQDLRKNSGLTPKDIPALHYFGNDDVKGFIESVTKNVMQSCVLSQIVFDSGFKGEDLKIGDYSIKLKIV